MVNEARVTALDDEALVRAVRRTLVEFVVPRLEETGSDEFLISELKSCLSMLDFAGRGLMARQAARAEAGRRLAELFDGRAPGSAWAGSDPNTTGTFLARARRPDSVFSESDRRLAGQIRELLRERLRVEIESRIEER